MLSDATAASARTGTKFNCTTPGLQLLQVPSVRIVDGHLLTDALWHLPLKVSFSWTAKPGPTLNAGTKLSAKHKLVCRECVVSMLV